MTLLMVPSNATDPSSASSFISQSASYNRLQKLLDRTSNALDRLDLSGMNEFVYELDRTRLEVSADVWSRVISDIVAPHRILAQLHQEPFTRRAFMKPRGYAGDAPMLDLAYRDRPYSVELTRLGAALHAWVDPQPATQSVRERRTILAHEIDAVAERREDARVLSLACGHLREAQVSDAVQRRAIADFIALDQDAESLAVVEREQRDVNVRVQRASVRRYIASAPSLGEFDFAYTAGLFDYLSVDDATAVTNTLFRSLRPGGRMLVANFAPELRDIGYLEAIMDWRLIYRDEATLLSFANGIDESAIADLSTSRDSNGNVVYMTIDRR